MQQLWTLISRFIKTVLRRNMTQQPRGHKTQPYHLCVIPHSVPVPWPGLSVSLIARISALTHLISLYN